MIVIIAKVVIIMPPVKFDAINVPKDIIYHMKNLLDVNNVLLHVYHVHHLLHAKVVLKDITYLKVSAIHV